MAGIGGAERHLMVLLPALKEQGIEVELLCIYLERDESEIPALCLPIEKEGILVHKIGSTSRLNYALLKGIAKVIEQGKYDVVHSHLIVADTLASLVKLLFRKRFLLISTKHNYSYQYQTEFGIEVGHRMRDSFYFTSRFTGKYVDHSICVSEGLRQLFIDQSICKAENSSVIFHALAANQGFSTPTDTYRKSQKQLLVIGRLLELKGHKRVLSVLREIEEEIPSIHLSIVGDGPYRPTIEEEIKKRNLQSLVSLEGFQEHPLDWMRDADVMVMPSSGEGFGLVFLECFRAGVPVIAFDVPAGNEVIEDNKNGYLVKPFDCNALKDRIIALLLDRNKRSEFVEAGRSSLKAKFSLELMVQNTVNCYERELANK